MSIPHLLVTSRLLPPLVEGWLGKFSVFRFPLSVFRFPFSAFRFPLFAPFFDGIEWQSGFQPLMTGAFVIQRENRAFAILCHSATSGSDCHSLPLFFETLASGRSCKPDSPSPTSSNYFVVSFAHLHSEPLSCSCGR